ncbi:MAG: methylmalonyl-CoA mutase family protein, partial [Acidobacteria bacterium]|nr:methylmalonyl-CoA mutase family protein [Acidobacteriota bacterium]
PIPILRIDPALKEAQIKRLKKVRAQRDKYAVEKCLKSLKDAAISNENIMPPTLEAVKCYTTIGEIIKTLKEVFGVYKAS